MPDMKVRIVIENGDGTTRTATLSFEEVGAPKKTEEKPKRTLLDRFEDLHFDVRRGIPMLEPGMIGEIHVERLYGARDRCCECGAPTWILMEVIEDLTEVPDADHPFIEVDHDLIGDFCILCGHFHLNEDMVGAGVLGLIEEGEYENVGSFLDTIEDAPDDETVRIRFMNALQRQERMHTKAAMRLRQRITQLRVETHEAKVLKMKEEE